MQRVELLVGQRQPGFELIADDDDDQSTTATLMERRLVAWTAGRAGLGPAADGVFTSGGTQSNLQALLLARDETLARLPGGVLPTGARLRILASGQAHFSVTKSARLLGLGAGGVLDPQPAPEDGVRMAWVHDPEGNLVELITPPPAA